MKHILLMIVMVVLVGCGGSKEKDEETSKAKVVAEAKEESAKVIEVVIRKKLNKPTGELTKADYEKVTELFPVFKNLTDVKELEKLTNLTQLELNGNKLTDVKGLEKLTQLKMLELYNNPDLTKAQIDQLKKALPNCKIYSNPPLTKEESAKKIEKAIRIELKKLTGELTEADLEKVTKLNLAGRQLTNVTGLEKLRLLSGLNLASNYITDVKGLEELTQLTRLYLNGNKLTDVKGLEKLTQLKMLRLQDNPDLTKAQIAELQKALPKCTILSNPTK